MNVYEKLFLQIIDSYRSAGLSLARVIRDPRFKEIPLTERIELLKKYGHEISADARIDSKFWKDVSLGALGTAAVLYEPVSHFMDLTHQGYQYGKVKRLASEAGVDLNLPAPAVDWRVIKGLSISAAGAGLAAPKLSEALRHRQAIKTVKSLLSTERDKNTDDAALKLISRT